MLPHSIIIGAIYIQRANIVGCTMAPPMTKMSWALKKLTDLLVNIRANKIMQGYITSYSAAMNPYNLTSSEQKEILEKIPFDEWAAILADLPPEASTNWATFLRENTKSDAL